MINLDDLHPKLKVVMGLFATKLIEGDPYALNVKALKTALKYTPGSAIVLVRDAKEIMSATENTEGIIDPLGVVGFSFCEMKGGEFDGLLGLVLLSTEIQGSL